jgi:type IV fimbrial biogenesis protein FimT
MRKQGGFTVMELMIVIAIIGILSAITVPNYISYRNNQQVSLAARDIYSALQSAKMSAITDNTTINVLFSPGTASAATYRVFEDLDADNAFDAAADRDIESGQMPPGITMANATFSGDAIATFSPMGMPRQPNGALDFGSVRVSNSNRCNSIIINSSGGIRIDVCP